MATDLGTFFWSGLQGGGGGGVTSLNSETGAITLLGTGGITITPSGQNITIDGSADSISIGAFGSTPNANGLSLAATVLNMQPADGTHPGGVSTVAQTFAGQKTFSTGLTGTLTGAASLNVLTSALGTMTEATSSILTLSGWTNATVGSPTIQVKQASGSQSGYLSSTDWTTFNNKSPSGNFATSGSGDVTWSAPSGPGAVTTSLTATTNATLTTASALVSVGTLTTGTWNATLIASGFGGTGFATYTKGDLLYCSATNVLSKLGIGSTGNLLTVAAGLPSWAAPATAGTVTSVAISVPGSSLFGISGSPVTSSGTLGVTTTGTSGGIPYFDTTSTLNSSALLTHYGVVYGGGAGASPVATAAGTTGQVLIATTSAAPSWAATPFAALNGIRYHGATATITGSASTVTFSTSDWDTASAYSSGTYTAPNAGYFLVSAKLQISFSSTATDTGASIYIYKNGSLYSNVFVDNAILQTLIQPEIIDVVKCAANDTIIIKVSSGLSSPTVNASNTANSLIINQIGI